MRTLLLFIIPPIAGALIGYVTNAIAIRMLFRPLKEVRIFTFFGKRGIRLPFTPGILPKQRHRLAQSIGGMVERELLTPEIVRQRLARPDVQEKIKSSLTDNIPVVLEKLYPVFMADILNFLNRKEIRLELESKGRIILRNILLKLSSLQRMLLSAGQYDLTLEEKMPEIIDELISNAQNLLESENVKKTLINAIANEAVSQRLITAADGQMENLLSSINVKALVSERIDSLDMLRVERIILDVMADQFKWINVFGGILGFLIGAFQAVLGLILR